MAGKHEGLKNEISRGSTEKRQDAILMMSSHIQKCLWPGLVATGHPSFAREVLAIQIRELSNLKSFTILKVVLFFR